MIQLETIYKFPANYLNKVIKKKKLSMTNFDKNLFFLFNFYHHYNEDIKICPIYT